MSDEEAKGARMAKSARSNGHPSSGGHVVAKSTLKQNNSALSRANRTRWDVTDGFSGGGMQYQYQEFPKHVYPTPGNFKHYVVVNTREEENKILGGEEIINEEDEHHRLLTVAAINKIHVDKRWGPARLTKAIEDAGFDPTLNPFK